EALARQLPLSRGLVGELPLALEPHLAEPPGAVLHVAERLDVALAQVVEGPLQGLRVVPQLLGLGRRDRGDLDRRRWTWFGGQGEANRHTYLLRDEFAVEVDASIGQEGEPGAQCADNLMFL